MEQADRRRLGAPGNAVVILARDEQAGGGAAAPNHIASLVNHAGTTFGRLDVLVDNAGIALEWDGKPTHADMIRRTLEVHLIASCAITEALVPLISRSGDARLDRTRWRAGG